MAFILAELSFIIMNVSILFKSLDLGPLQTELSTVISSVTTLLKGLGIAVCVLGIMVGGLMRATAFGNERKVAISNQAIACAVIGLVIVLVAQGAATAFNGLLP
jgi:hypothetical protein